MKKQTKKITLAKETLRSLTAVEATQAVQGGSFTCTLFNTCHCPTYSCNGTCTCTG